MVQNISLDRNEYKEGSKRSISNGTILSIRYVGEQSFTSLTVDLQSRWTRSVLNEVNDEALDDDVVKNTVNKVK